MKLVFGRDNMSNLKQTFNDKVFNIINSLLLILVAISALYPFLFVVFSSFSEAGKLAAHQGILYHPAGWSLSGYEMVMRYPGIKTGYLNTIFYVVVGTTLNVSTTGLLAYVIASKVLWRNILMILVVITMFFNGGLIPTFLLVKNLHLLNTRWAIILPSLISAWNVIIMRTFFQNMPDSLEESARIDGAGPLTIFLRIIVPLSTPVIAVMALYYGVGHWNSWFSAMIYLKSKALYPLQLFLREILIRTQFAELTGEIDALEAGYENINQDILKNAFIVISTLPILCLYPFLQKYFVKGVMIGALKG